MVTHARKESVDLSVVSLSSPHEAVPPGQQSGFARLEASLVAVASLDREEDRDRTPIVVRTSAVVLEHLAEHARRRLSHLLGESGRSPRIVFVSGTRVDEPWRELVRHLPSRPSSVPPRSPTRAPSGSEAHATALPVGSGGAVGGLIASGLDVSPREIADRILAARCDAIIIVEPTPSGFGRAVFTHLVEPEHADTRSSDSAGAAPSSLGGTRAPLFLFTSQPTSSRRAELGADLARAQSRFEIIDVDARLERDEVRAWWSSVTRDFDRLPNLDRLDALSAWWRAASSTPADAVAPAPGLSALAERLLVRLSLAGRAWPLGALSRLGARESQAQELVAAGLAIVSNDLVAIDARGAEAAAADRRVDDFVAVEKALLELFAEDPWAIMRAAEMRALSMQALRDSAGRDSAGRDSAGRDSAGRDSAGRDSAGRDSAGRDSAGRDSAGRDSQGRDSQNRDSQGHRDSHMAEDAQVEAMAMRAIASVIESETRDDLWRRYRALVGDKESGGRSADVASCLRTADLALRIGDVDRAVEFSRMAASADGESPDVLLTLGRATAATGDLTTAGVTIAKAMARSADGSPAWARAAVELAEVRYTTGEIAEARDLADRALACADAASVRLAARNVLGKILLAKAEYAAADQHFAGDACDAACTGESVAELRARLNRAIALMSASRLDEARGMLESVLELGEQRSEVKAVCFALGNLATIAILQHRYAEALALLERTIDIVRRIGDKPRLALFITNLAELRLRLGLDREAEQLLLFGRRVCGVTSPRFAQFSLVSARLQLSRGRTVEAMRDIATAMAGSGVSLANDGRALGALTDKDVRGWSGLTGMLVLECLRLAARAALDDGDTRRAADFIERATHESGTPRAKAEVVLLRAACARAGGESFAELADDALAAAREADDEDLVREAQLLCHHAALADDDRRRAHVHLDAAIALRNQVADSLPTWIRDRYLARHELGELARLETARAEAQRALASAPPSVAARDSYRPEPLAPSSRAERGRKIVGNDPTVRSLLAAIQKVGRSDTTVLVHGESGTGKELVAEALHEASARAGGPMVKVNCAALVETLLLSELFGHEKGAFTGAAGRRRGRFEAADGGTLFLDEIGDISPRTQVALLRVLQEKTFERVGGTASIRANVRVVCATHRDLKSLVAKGEFREDLYYRLCGVVLEVPALRQRLGDLGLVADALLRRIAEERGGAPKTLSASALSALKQHTWPGNIRELENALRAASLFAEGGQIEVEDFTDNVESLRSLSTEDLGMAPAAAESVAGRSSASARTSMARSGVGPNGVGPNGVGPSGVVPSGVGPSGSGPSSVGPSTTRSGSEGGECPAGATSSGASAPSSTGGGSPTEVAYAHVRAGVSLAEMKKQIERECIARALGETDGNITRAATLLGMKRPRLSQLVKQYGLGGDGETWAGEIDDEGDEA